MKKLFILGLFFISVVNIAQFKGDDSKPVDIRSGILSNTPLSSLFSFVDPSKFNMNHSFEMSYSSFGNNGIAMGVYTNLLSYEFSDELNVQINTSFVNSPYNTLGEGFTNSINGVYLDRAKINYNPSENFKISLQFSNSPFGYNNYYSNRRYSPLSNIWDDE